MNIVRAYGLKKDDHEEFDRKFGKLRGANEHFGAPRNLSSEALDVANALGPFHDQEETNSCTGHGLTCAADARLRVQGVKAPYGSPLAAYTGGCTLAKKTKDEKLVDDGAYPRLVMRWAAESGVPAETEWPLKKDGKYQTKIELPPDVMQRASAWKLVETYRVYAKGQSLIDAVCAALAQKHPLIAATDTDDVFEQYKGGGPENAIPAPDKGKIRGAHMIAIVAYKTLSNGKRVFMIANSWAKWGNPGSLAWVTEEWLMACVDLYAFSLTHGPATSDEAPRGGDKVSVTNQANSEDNGEYVVMGEPTADALPEDEEEDEGEDEEGDA